ncbi:type VI secretion system contractile sheath small subunit [Roseateles sp. BYS180W]|uniref:Type VI secretion system contractile sheath small subunit n=1 Tax=Roseateles rivi TaxID=3299028 RepID=A0ABW7FS26_9BURK
MAKNDSVQKRLQKVRPPRVQLSYDVEIGNGVEQREIPFVTGVIGDFTGKADPNKPQPKLRDRKFVNIDLDSFDDVMAGMSPKAGFRVVNKLSGDGELGVNLEFNAIDDFRPEAVMQQVEPLRKLLEARTKLSDLRNKLAGNEKLEDLLGDVLSNTEKLQQLSHETAKEGE